MLLYGFDENCWRFMTDNPDTRYMFASTVRLKSVQYRTAWAEKLESLLEEIYTLTAAYNEKKKRANELYIRIIQ
jgi:hypothetical protein